MGRWERTLRAGGPPALSTAHQTTKKSQNSTILSTASPLALPSTSFCPLPSAWCQKHEDIFQPLVTGVVIHPSRSPQHFERFSVRTGLAHLFRRNEMEVNTEKMTRTLFTFEQLQQCRVRNECNVTRSTKKMCVCARPVRCSVHSITNARTSMTQKTKERKAEAVLWQLLPTFIQNEGNPSFRQGPVSLTIDKITDEQELNELTISACPSLCCERIHQTQ